MVFEEAEKGDELAIRIVKETARYLSHGMISLIHTLDPSCLLLGGAMTFGGDETATGRLFLKTVEEETRSRIFLHLAERLRIAYATTGNAAGYILARQVLRVKRGKKVSNDFEAGALRRRDARSLLGSANLLEAPLLCVYQRFSIRNRAKDYGRA